MFDLWLHAWRMYTVEGILSNKKCPNAISRFKCPFCHERNCLFGFLDPSGTLSHLFPIAGKCTDKIWIGQMAG